MLASGTKVGAVAAVLAVVLTLASSLCVVTCLAVDNPGVPPCHRHAPSNASACSHAALTAIEQTLCTGVIVPAIARVRVPEPAVHAGLAEVEAPVWPNSLPVVTVLRI